MNFETSCILYSIIAYIDLNINLEYSNDLVRLELAFVLWTGSNMMIRLKYILERHYIKFDQ